MAGGSAAPVSATHNQPMRRIMAQQIPVDDAAVADAPPGADGTHEITRDLAYQRHALVNVIFWGRPARGTGSGC